MFSWELIEEDYYICIKGFSLYAFLFLLGDMTEAFCLVCIILESPPNFCFIMILIFISFNVIIFLSFLLSFFSSN